MLFCNPPSYDFVTKNIFIKYFVQLFFFFRLMSSLSELLLSNEMPIACSIFSSLTFIHSFNSIHRLERKVCTFFHHSTRFGIKKLNTHTRIITNATAKKVIYSISWKMITAVEFFVHVMTCTNFCFFIFFEICLNMILHVKEE